MSSHPTLNDNKYYLANWGIDVETKTVFIVGAIDEGLFLRLVIALRMFRGEACTVVLNSYGGEIVNALAMIEAMRAYSGQIRTHATGACMSAGALILQAGHVRSATPDCSLLVHFGHEENASGSQAKHNAKLTARMKQILKERTGKSPKTINKWLEADTYFTAEEALKAKLIDEVTT